MSSKTKLAKSLSAFDVGAVTALFIFAVHALVTIMPLDILPSTWIVIIITFVLVVAILTLIASLFNNRFIHYFQRFLIIIICISATGATYAVQKVDKALDEIIESPTSYKEYISIITLRNPETISLSDIEGGKIAVQDTLDQNNMNTALTYLNSKYSKDVTTVSYSDYPKAIAALYEGKVSAIIMSENYRTLIETNIEDFAEKTSVIDAIEIETPFVSVVKKIDVTTNPFVILVSGMDELGKANRNLNSDVNMLLAVNPLTKTISMISIPRDSYLPNACLANQNDKLTHTGNRGIDCTIKTLENAFDIEINYYAKVTFSSLINLINEIGGVYIDVPMSFCERKANRVDIIRIKKGPQTLNGEQALALARNRHNVSGGDVGRAKNQQMIVNAIIRKVLTPEIISKIDSVISVVSETVETSLSKDEIYSLVKLATSDLSTQWTFSNNTIKGTNGWGECASIPGTELSVVNLSDLDILKVQYIIKQLETDADLSELTFNINDMSAANEEITVEGETTGAKGYDFCWIDEAIAQKKKAQEEALANGEDPSQIEDGDEFEYQPSIGDEENNDEPTSNEQVEPSTEEATKEPENNNEMVNEETPTIEDFPVDEETVEEPTNEETPSNEESLSE